MYLYSSEYCSEDCSFLALIRCQWHYGLESISDDAYFFVQLSYEKQFFSKSIEQKKTGVYIIESLLVPPPCL